MRTFIFNARLVDEKTDERGSIIIDNGKIEKIFFYRGDNPGITDAVNTDIASCELHINAGGKALLPSFIDMHAHFRYPGQTEKEDLDSGLKAASAGGYTTVVLMPNTNPVISSQEEAASVMQKAETNGTAKVYQTVSITKRFDGSSIDHLNGLSKDSVPVVTEDGKDVASCEVMKLAMSVCAQKKIIVSCHCEKNEYVSAAKKFRDEGNYRKAEKILRKAEDEATKRNLDLAIETDCPIHIAHCSTKKSLQFVIKAQRKERYEGQVSCEITPHHACLSYEMKGLNKELVNPPLRKNKDRYALIKALAKEKNIMIGTDHAPHTLDDKRNGACGFSGIETAFSLCYTTLVLGNKVDLKRLSTLMSAEPARRLGLNKGLIKTGMDADLVLVDLNESYTVQPEKFFSKGKYTPLSGKKLFGIICKTFYKGNVVYE